MRTILKFIFLLIITSNCFADEILPTDTDLKAAYCRVVLQELVNEYRDPSLHYPQSFITKASSNLNRINGYFMPRLYNLEMTGILSASSTAYSDIKNIRNESESWQKR